MSEELIQNRRFLHENPELGFEEVMTTKKIKEWLAKHDIPIMPLDLTTGIVAEIKGVFGGQC